MSRPKTHLEERVTTAIRLPESLHSRLSDAASERDVSVNYLVTRAVEDFLEHLIPVADLPLTRR